MKRLTRFQENISVRKATNYAIIINSLEILLILGVMTLVVISPQYDFSPRMMRLLVGVAAAVIIWGAVMDIREAMSTRRLLSQLDAMDDTSTPWKSSTTPSAPSGMTSSTTCRWCTA